VPLEAVLSFPRHCFHISRMDHAQTHRPHRRREMYERNDRSRLMVLQNLIEPVAIAYVAYFQRTSLDEFSVTVGEVVINDRGDTLVEQVEARVRSDISRSACHKNISHSGLLPGTSCDFAGSSPHQKSIRCVTICF
jgi:hypothetical protein